MKKMFFAGAALAALAAAPALAQQGGEGRGRFAQPQTRADVQAQVQARFARADSNRDGFVTQDEVRAGAEARGGQRQERRGGRGGMMAGFGGRAFAAMDLDSDGRVALAEAQRAALQRFDRVDSNRDGTITLDERQAARAASEERREERRED
jgi:EF hand